MTAESNVIAGRRRVLSSLSDEHQGLLLAAVGVVAFSFTLPFTKIAVRGIDPIVAAMGRAVVASVLSAAVLVATRTRRPSRQQIRQLGFVVGGVVIGFPVATSYALRHTDSGHGAIVIGLLPLATAGVATIRAGERPSALYWWCSAAGFGAVLGYVVVDGGGSINGADAVLVVAVLAAAVGYTEGALLAREIGGWQVITWALVLASVVTWPVTAVASWRTGLDASVGQWAAFSYTALCSMLLGFFAWYAGLAKAGIARAGQLQLAQPALSLLWGWPILGERLTPTAGIAVFVVLAAVAIGRRAPIRSVAGARGPKDTPSDTLREATA